jgi:hypothetical protein
VLLAVIIRSFEGSLISEFFVALSCAGAIPIAIAAAYIAENVAKRRWLSGRWIRISDEGMVAASDPNEEHFYDWNGHMSLTKWYFRLSGFRRGGRERRIPAEWLCMCIQVQQDEHRFVAFAYMPVGKAEQYLDDSRFQELRPGDYEESRLFSRWFSPPKRPEIPTKILAGKQGHFWLAERKRWDKGMEFEIDDFNFLMNEIAQRVID